jgi:carbamoyltransferase
MAELYAGLARARLGPAAAIIDVQRGVVTACEENRLTRARQAATQGPPELALAELLAFLQRSPADIAAVGVVTGEDRVNWSPGPTAVAVDGHDAHAAYAFHSSGFTDALVVVCEVHKPRGWSAWHFKAGEPARPVGETLGDFPLAQIYSQLTIALGFHQTRDEHVVEAMARAGRDTQTAIADLVRISPDGVSVDPGFSSAIDAALRTSDPDATRRDIAASVQRRMGECLVQLLTGLAGLGGPTQLCLSGGLFFNTFFTTIAATSGAFASVHVPPHPGRNGTAVGAALRAGATASSDRLGSAYLGPAYSDGQIKEALDNCKLSYDLIREDRLLGDVLTSLARGRLVGWFHSRLEWGPRALGHRSVLADPFAPHTLDNLNGFLKRRPAYRSYGVSVPLASPFMQFEYRPRDRERFRTILPPGVQTLRVHTVDEREPRFLRLLEQWDEKTGTPVLVNTSFNGFHEPLVCSPRDAIRVFYGTGLDVLALEDFVLRK